MQQAKADSEYVLRRSLVAAVEKEALTIRDLQELQVAGDLQELNELLADLGFGSIQRAHIRRHLTRWAEEENTLAPADAPATEATQSHLDLDDFQHAASDEDRRRRAESEGERLRQELEDERQRAAGQEERRMAEIEADEERRRVKADAEAEQKRKETDDDERRRAAEEEANRRCAESEAERLRKELEDERQRTAGQEEGRRAEREADEDRRRAKAEAEDAWKRREEEAQRAEAEAEQKKKEADDERQRAVQVEGKTATFLQRSWRPRQVLRKDEEDECQQVAEDEETRWAERGTISLPTTRPRGYCHNVPHPEREAKEERHWAAPEEAERRPAEGERQRVEAEADQQKCEQHSKDKPEEPSPCLIHEEVLTHMLWAHSMEEAPDKEDPAIEDELHIKDASTMMGDLDKVSDSELQQALLAQLQGQQQLTPRQQQQQQVQPMQHQQEQAPQAPSEQLPRMLDSKQQMNKEWIRQNATHGEQVLQIMEQRAAAVAAGNQVRGSVVVGRLRNIEALQGRGPPQANPQQQAGRVAATQQKQVAMQSFEIGLKNMDEDGGETDDSQKHNLWNVGLGIDLGLYTICAASWNGAEVDHVFGPELPCINILDSGKVLCGDEVAACVPADEWFFPMRYLADLQTQKSGRFGKKFMVNGDLRFFFFAELLALLLCWVRERAEQKSGQRFASLSLNTHSCFGLAKRRILHEATVLAGFERARLLRTPVSGALWLYLKQDGVVVEFLSFSEAVPSIKKSFAFGATVRKLKAYIVDAWPDLARNNQAWAMSIGVTILKDENATLLSLGATGDRDFVVQVTCEAAEKPPKKKTQKRKQAAGQASASASTSTETPERQVILIDIAPRSFDIAHVVVDNGIFEVRWAGGSHLGWKSHDRLVPSDRLVDYITALGEMSWRLTNSLRSLLEPEERWPNTFGRELCQFDDVILLLHPESSSHEQVTQGSHPEAWVSQITDLLSGILSGLGLEQPITTLSWRDFRHVHACGAAMQGAILGTGHQSGPLQSLMLIDSCAQAIGIGFEMSKVVCVVDAHVPIPTTKSLDLRIQQKWKGTSDSVLDIYEKVEGAGVSLLGFIRLSNIADGDRLQVCFEVGTAGQVNVHTGFRPGHAPDVLSWTAHNWIETRRDNLTVSEMRHLFRGIMFHRQTGWAIYGLFPYSGPPAGPCCDYLEEVAHLPKASYTVLLGDEDEDGIIKMSPKIFKVCDGPPKEEEHQQPGDATEQSKQHEFSAKLPQLPSPEESPDDGAQNPPKASPGGASSQRRLKDRRGQKVAEALRQKLDKKKQMQKSTSSEGPEDTNSEAIASEHGDCEKNNVCAVCLCTEEELGKSFPFVLQKCGHKCICKPCLRKMKAKNKQVEVECPLCRVRSKPVLAEKYGGNVFTAKLD